MALVEDFGEKFLAILLIMLQHFLLSADGQEADRIGQYPQHYSSKYDVSNRGYEDISPIDENVHRANFKGYESHIHIEPTEMSLDVFQSLMKSPQHDITSGEEPYGEDRIDTDSELNKDYGRTSSYFENIDESAEYVDDETTDDEPRQVEPSITNSGVERPDDNVNGNTKKSRIDNHPKTITWRNDGPSLGHRRLRGVDKNGPPLLSQFGYPRPRNGFRSPRREDFRQTSDTQAVYDRSDRPRLTEENYYKSNSNFPLRESRLGLRLSHPEISEKAPSEMDATDETDGRSNGNGYYRESEKDQVNWRSQPTEDRDVFLPHIMDNDDEDDDYDDDDGDDSIYGRRMNSFRGLMNIPKDADVSMKGHGWTILDEPIETHRLPFTDLESQEGQSLNHEYRRYFGELDDSIAFEMPELHVNCWLQAMMATTWGFSPSCNEDGTYGPKQCHEKRCWCVDKFGRKVQQHGGKTDEGFYFGLRGLTLYCSEN